MPRPLFTPGKDPVPTVQEAGWDPGPVCTGAENLAPTGIRSHSHKLHNIKKLNGKMPFFDMRNYSDCSVVMDIIPKIPHSQPDTI